MKKFIVMCSILILPGLNALAQTNVVPLTSYPVPYPKLREEKPAATLKAERAHVVPAQGRLSPTLEIRSAQFATYARVEREGLLNPRITNNNPGEALETIFGPENDLWGEADTRDPVMIIFPTGR